MDIRQKPFGAQVDVVPPEGAAWNVLEGSLAADDLLAQGKLIPCGAIHLSFTTPGAFLERFPADFSAKAYGAYLGRQFGTLRKLVLSGKKVVVSRVSAEMMERAAREKVNWFDLVPESERFQPGEMIPGETCRCRTEPENNPQNSEPWNVFLVAVGTIDGVTLCMVSGAYGRTGAQPLRSRVLWLIAPTADGDLPDMDMNSQPGGRIVLANDVELRFCERCGQPELPIAFGNAIWNLKKRRAVRR